MSDALHWCLLIHQLPPRPLYLRAKIRNRLARVGALPLKSTVYVLPLRDDCLEDLLWIAQEAQAGGGEAFVCRAQLASGITDAALVEAFQANASAAYESLRQELERGGAAGELPRLKKRLAECADIDFFAAPSGKEITAMLEKLERKASPKKPAAPPAEAAALKGRTWVTRRGVKVDRIATVWLVRRFVDPAARVRFVDPQRFRKGEGELTFDMLDADFTHQGERCTFETLLARLSPSDPALDAIAEIVHDIDLKDARFNRSEAEGVRRAVDGIVSTHAGDPARLEAGAALFDALYASFSGSAPARVRSRDTQTGAARVRSRDTQTGAARVRSRVRKTP